MYVVNNEVKMQWLQSGWYQRKSRGKTPGAFVLHLSHIRQPRPLLVGKLRYSSPQLRHSLSSAMRVLGMPKSFSAQLRTISAAVSHMTWRSMFRLSSPARNTAKILFLRSGVSWTPRRTLKPGSGILLPMVRSVSSRITNPA